MQATEAVPLDKDQPLSAVPSCLECNGSGERSYRRPIYRGGRPVDYEVVPDGSCSDCHGTGRRRCVACGDPAELKRVGEWVCRACDICFHCGERKAQFLVYGSEPVCTLCKDASKEAA